MQTDSCYSFGLLGENVTIRSQKKGGFVFLCVMLGLYSVFVE